MCLDPYLSPYKMNIEWAVTARKKSYPLNIGKNYYTKDSNMVENGVDLPTIYLKWVTWSNNVKKYILANKKDGWKGKVLESENRSKTYKLQNMSILI